jgi:NADH dehydrogenase
MKVLITGGTGLVGAAVVSELLRRGHDVRVASRHAEAWAERVMQADVDVEAVDVDVTEEGSLSGAAEGCDAVVHLAGTIDTARAGERLFEVNIAGTRQVLDEAARAGVRRFVHISALGVDHASDAHQVSKLRSEDEVRTFGGSWIVLRPGMVIGPRDQTTTLLLRLLRLSPIVPLVGDGQQRLQPIWHEDLGRAVAAALEREDLSCRVLEVAGGDVTTPRQLVELMASLIGKRPRFMRLPRRSVTVLSRLACALGLTPPLNRAKLTMLLEGSVIEPPEANALEGLIERPPTSLRDGLKALLHDLPLQPMAVGYGPVQHKRYRATIHDPARTPDEIATDFRTHYVEVMPLDFHAEPSAARQLEVGSTLCLRIPFRGQMLMRVVEVTPRAVTLATVAGHPISGAVRFAYQDADSTLAFAVDVYARASNRIDQLGLWLFGGLLQNAHWKTVARRGARLSRGRVSHHVQHDVETLRGEKAKVLEKAMAHLAEATERPATIA